MSSSIWVSRVVLDSDDDGLDVTIHLRRSNYPILVMYVPPVTDVPKDIRHQLLAWLNSGEESS